ncbi:MAG: hypothetical protein A3J24_04985 [Deltaproteobacteria bacterium RIFCSPLOWO2_02_FULL_53_8]|nr:MAG: hypothetical protein A3J24_04985 [Deltaproteobacteria bacterium RIFCSPLOWO2_02_FULL_53_8]
MSRNSIKILALAAFIIGIFIIARHTGVGDYLEQERLRAWIGGFGVWGPVVYIVVFCAAPVLMLPGLPLTIIGGVLFGPLWGSVYVMTGATIGACAAFLFARYMGRKWVATIIKDTRLDSLDAQVKQHGWKLVAITRLIPLFPFNLLNYAFGLTSVKFSHYAAASFFFMIPGAVAYVVFSSSLLDAMKGRVSAELVIGIILVIIVSLAPLVYKRIKKG